MHCDKTTSRGNFFLWLCDEDSYPMALSLATQAEFYATHPSDTDLPNDYLNVMESERKLAEAILKTGQSVIAVRNNEAIGLAHFRCEESIGYAYLDYLYVVASERKNGVGNALVKFVESHLPSICRRIKVQVAVDDEYATSFFEKSGYYKDYTVLKKRLRNTKGNAQLQGK